MTNDERSLEKALDEIDRWSEQMVAELEWLSLDQVLEYFAQAQVELEREIGKPLNLPIRRAPREEKVS
jgi:hypothetical protein